MTFSVGRARKGAAYDAGRKSASGKRIAIAHADKLVDANKAGSGFYTPVGAKAWEESLRIHFFVILRSGFS